MDLPFFPGRKPELPEPMSVFLAPCNAGVGAEFVRRLGGTGKRVVDPFGQSPLLALEMARSGAAVLVASPNPVIRAWINFHAAPPSPQLIRRVMERLSQPAPAPFSPGAHPPESMEAHIRSLYAGTCVFCGKDSEAEGFIWAREESAEDFALPPVAERRKAPRLGKGVTGEGKESPPEESPDFLPSGKDEKGEARLVKRICHCPHCDHTIEEPATPADDERARPFESRALQFHLALERLSPPDDPDRIHATEALGVYPPRSLYALFTLLIRLEALNLDAEERRCADLLMLSALDEAHILRGHGRSTRVRPRSLQPPGEYREANIWLLVERAAAAWSRPAHPVPVARWRAGDELQPGAIAVFAGPARDLAPHLDAVKPSSIITFFPRPNQAAWTLSAMWAGWLWGRQTAAPLGPVLRRRRYDWNWHARALTASAVALAGHLDAGVPLLGMLGESEPEFFAAVVWSFQQAGFTLRSRAMRADTNTAQILWSAPGPGTAPSPLGPAGCEPSFDVARLAARQVISWRVEPVPWDVLHAAAWTEAAAHHMIPAAGSEEDEATFSHCQAAIHDAIQKDPAILTTREESDHGHFWWLPGDDLVANPLADQVEMEAARILLVEGPLTAEDLDARICAFFPGLLTPEGRLVRACLDSYGRVMADGPAWGIRLEDMPASREVELRIVRDGLCTLGRRLGFSVEDDETLCWKDAFGHRTHHFFPIATGMVGRHLLQPGNDPRTSWIVLPGGRSPLVQYKIKRNVRLSKAVENGWGFLKFRHLRNLLAEQRLGPNNINDWLKMDPLKAREDELPFF